MGRRGVIVAQVTYEGGDSGGGGSQYRAGLVAFAEPQGFLGGGDFQAVGRLIFAGERGLLPTDFDAVRGVATAGERRLLPCDLVPHALASHKSFTSRWINSRDSTTPSAAPSS